MSGGDDRAAHLWDAATGEPIGLPLLHRGKINAVAFSKDGKVAATASEDKTARLWDVATGLPLGPPLRHKGVVNTLAFDPDGRTLLTGGADNMIHFWRVPLPISGAVEQIKAEVEVARGMPLSPEGVINNLEVPVGQTRNEKWASKSRGGLQLPDSASPFDRPSGEALAWHQQQALDSMAAENWEAVLWHLQRHIRTRPDDWLAYVLQQTKANLQLEHVDQAAANLANALNLGPAEPVLNWYRSYASERADKEEWIWYLDHLIERCPMEAELYVQRARVWSKRNHWKEASVDYARTVELNREDASSTDRSAK